MNEPIIVPEASVLRPLEASRSFESFYGALVCVGVSGQRRRGLRHGLRSGHRLDDEAMTAPPIQMG